jgi:hypothetical protein
VSCKKFVEVLWRQPTGIDSCSPVRILPSVIISGNACTAFVVRRSDILQAEQGSSNRSEIYRRVQYTPYTQYDAVEALRRQGNQAGGARSWPSFVLAAGSPL